MPGLAACKAKLLGFSVLQFFFSDSQIFQQAWARRNRVDHLGQHSFGGNDVLCGDGGEPGLARGGLVGVCHGFTYYGQHAYFLLWSKSSQPFPFVFCLDEVRIT